MAPGPISHACFQRCACRLDGEDTRSQLSVLSLRITTNIGVLSAAISRCLVVAIPAARFVAGHPEWSLRIAPALL